MITKDDIPNYAPETIDLPDGSTATIERDWCADKWQWIGVVVEVTRPNGSADLINELEDDAAAVFAHAQVIAAQEQLA